jgi:hypothetical protein
MNNLRCFITNPDNGEKQEYICPTYTKLNSVYGYICVDAVSNTVYFFYEYEGRVQSDKMENFEVSYEK